MKTFDRMLAVATPQLRAWMLANERDLRGRVLPDLASEEWAQRPVIYFASGSNHPGEIRGFAQLGQALGVAAPRCTAPCQQALIEQAGTGLPIFIDSGAFSEVELNVPSNKPRGKTAYRGPVAAGALPFPDHPIGTWVTVDPIEHADWLELLAKYKHLARYLGSQLYAVAPDKVAHTKTSLERLRRYAPQVQDLRDLGANILVPLQRGPGVKLADYYGQAAAALGTDDFISGIPSAKAATSIEEIEEFVRQVKPRRVHLLGMGLRSRDASEYIARIQAANPGIQIFLDSVLLRGSRVFKGMRAAWKDARDDLDAERFHRYRTATEVPGATAMPVFADLWNKPSKWVTSRAGLVRIAEDAIYWFPDFNRREFLKDPDGYLDTDREGMPWGVWLRGIGFDPHRHWSVPPLSQTPDILDDAFVAAATGKGGWEVAARKQAGVVRGIGPLLDD